MQCWGLRPTLDSRSDSDGLFFTTGGIEEGQHVCYLAVCPVPIPTHSPIPCLCSDQILYPLGFWGLGKVQSRLYQHIQCSSMIILCATGTKMTPFLFFFFQSCQEGTLFQRDEMWTLLSPQSLREGLNGRKTFSFGHCPNHLNPPPPLTPIRATWSFIFRRQNSRFESHLRGG